MKSEKKVIRRSSTKLLGSQFAVLDICSGLGGISYAAKLLGVEIIGGVDISEKALRTYSKNFKNATTVNGDISKRETLKKCFALKNGLSKRKKLIVVSGPPCQGFSIAGNRDPNDPRNFILIKVARAIVALKPKLALVENVSTILSPSHRRRVKYFTKILKKAGYFVAVLQVDAQEYGVPQRRRRVLFFISRKPTSSDTYAAELRKGKLPPISVGEALHGLPKSRACPEEYTDELEGMTKFPNHFAMRHSEKVKSKIAGLKPGEGPLSYRRLHPNRPANTMLSGHRAPAAHFRASRSITVREAARLQGFPDSFRVYGNFGAQMEQITNAVPPPLAKIALVALIKKGL